MLRNFIFACFALVAVLFSAAAAFCQSQTTSTVRSTSASVGIVIDSSKSTTWDIESLKKGALDLVHRFNFDDELAIFAASDTPKLVQDFTGDTDLAAKAVKHLPSKGKPNLYKAVAHAVQHVRSDGVNDAQAVVAFTNHLDRADSGSANNLEQLIRRKQGLPVYIVVMGPGSWRSQELAERIAVLSGGAAYFPAKESQVAAISDALASRLGAGSDKQTVRPTAARLQDMRQWLCAACR
jgi:Mg-chelatase subunit ChlD